MLTGKYLLELKNISYPETFLVLKKYFLWTERHQNKLNEKLIFLKLYSKIFPLKKYNPFATKSHYSKQHLSRSVWSTLNTISDLLGLNKSDEDLS